MRESRTLIIQSHNFQVLRGWIGRCVDSVREWSESSGYEYRFLGDEIFDLIPNWYRDKVSGRMPIQADLARLILIRDALASGFDRAVWFDADLLVFAPDRLDLDQVQDTCAFGRELWVGTDPAGRLKTWRSIHNAVCLFQAGDPVLPFLIHTVERIIDRADADRIAPQMVGPKLLTALDNIAGFGRIETVAAFSPLVLRDIDAGGGDALASLKSAIGREKMPMPAAANLCASLSGDRTSDELLERVVRRLLKDRALP
ncbi:MAG: hypothetical protein R8L07_20015 [Alphaproteobacteria bacterium]|nr:hypothetical protein [Alphaproteobacteria bacterium]